LLPIRINSTLCCHLTMRTRKKAQWCQSYLTFHLRIERAQHANEYHIANGERKEERVKVASLGDNHCC
jgi:type II secretory pathway component PulL